jgi:hypothetical protein
MCFHGIVLNYLITGTTLDFELCVYKATFEERLKVISHLLVEIVI